MTPARAKAFYGAVFGWKTLPLAGGRMWTLPGYGDHLEESHPGPARADGARWARPDGFIDVVAALTPIADGDTDDAARTGASRSRVDDAEATAAAARELGGEVVAGPFDAPVDDDGHLKDPQGATFIASQFVPENRNLTSQEAASLIS